MKDTVTSNPGEDLIIIVLKHPVHLWEVVSNQLVLERAADLELETLLGSGGELWIHSIWLT